MISNKRVVVEGKTIFNGEGGTADAPTTLLLHGFPTSSHMFRNLIPALAESYHLVAPDLPGFGFSDSLAPNCQRCNYRPSAIGQPRL